jgi:hypothetical protein
MSATVSTAEEWQRFDALREDVRQALADAAFQWAVGPVAQARFDAMSTAEAVAFIEAHDRAYAERHALVHEAGAAPVQE